MKLLANSKSLTVPAPVGGAKRGVPYMHGERLVVPAESAEEGQSVTVYTRGVFDEHKAYIAKAVTPAYEGETAYWKEGAFTNVKEGAIKVGYFLVEHGVETIELIGA